MRLLPYHSHIVSWLFIVFELLLIAYQCVRGHVVRRGWHSWLSLIVLLLLLVWNALLGYGSELFVLVNVNTISLIIVVALMAMPFLGNRRGARSSGKDDLPDDLKSTLPSERFMENCRNYQLSTRELEVVLLIRKGLKNKEIGDELFISERTVEGHLRNIYDKVGSARRKLALINKLNS